ncbi:TetR/AcrR family transcriptional regulator [Pseudomonas turukhanskensis]
MNNAMACRGDIETMAHRQVPPVRKLDNQGHVLSNAARLFREKGFEKTSLKDIAEACDMLPGSLYYRYSTKEALLVELMRRGVDLVTAEVEMALTSSDEPVERLRLCINAHLRALLVDSDTVYVLLFEWRALGPEAREEIIELRDQYESLWADILETMIEQGVIQKGVDGRLLRLIGLGALNWVATWFDPKGAYTLDAIGDFIWKITIDGVINQDECCPRF